MSLPIEYVQYIDGDGPKDGGLSADPGRFQLWPVDEIDDLNREYEVDKYAPGFLAFGSNGGDEMLAFDDIGQIVSIPFIGMDPADAMPVAESWADFVALME